MLMNKRIINALVLLLLVTGAMAQNVTTDNSFRIGKLKNGMTYYIRHNAKVAMMIPFGWVDLVDSRLLHSTACGEYT